MQPEMNVKQTNKQLEFLNESELSQINILWNKQSSYFLKLAILS